MSEPKKIIAAAIVFGTEVWVGEPEKDKWQDILERYRNNNKDKKYPIDCCFGFLDSDGQFQDSHSAAIIAGKAEQIQHYRNAVLPTDLW